MYEGKFDVAKGHRKMYEGKFDVVGGENTTENELCDAE